MSAFGFRFSVPVLGGDYYKCHVTYVEGNEKRVRWCRLSIWRSMALLTRETYHVDPVNWLDILCKAVREVIKLEAARQQSKKRGRE